MSNYINNTPIVSFDSRKEDQNGKERETVKLYFCEDRYELYLFGNLESSNDNSLYIDIIRGLNTADHSKELHVFINSYGGSIDTLVMFMTAISQFSWVVTIGMGTVMSAGFVLWCMAPERYASPVSNFLHHAWSSFMYGPRSRIEGLANVNTKRDDILDEYVGVAGVLTPEEMKRAKDADIFLLGDDLLKRGACNHIDDYYTRPKFEIGNHIVIGEELYIQEKDGTFRKVQKSKGKPLTYADLLQKNYLLTHKQEAKPEGKKND